MLRERQRTKIKSGKVLIDVYKRQIYNSVLVKEREITFASLLPGVPMNACTSVTFVMSPFIVLIKYIV